MRKLADLFLHRFMLQVSGTVKAIEPHFNPTGAKVNCIVVENDGEYKEVEYAPVKPLEEMIKRRDT